MFNNYIKTASEEYNTLYLVIYCRQRQRRLEHNGFMVVVVVVIAGAWQVDRKWAHFAYPLMPPQSFSPTRPPAPSWGSPRSSNEGQDKFPFQGVHFLFSERRGANEFIPQAPERSALSQELEKCFFIVFSS